MKKKPVHIIVIFLILLVSLILCTGFCFADSIDRPLAPDLDDVRTYELAEKIASETQATRDVTYTTDDIYNILTSVRTYVDSSYKLKVYDSAVLGALQDLNGYNTAYNTHSMLVDMWNRIGGNSQLSSAYSLIDYAHDINLCLEISDGNESYNITELLAGIYNISATPKNLYDIWYKLGDVATSSDNTTSMLGYIYNDISSIKSIIASADVLQAKQDQQDYEDDALTNFTGSGSAAASRSDQGNIKDTSRALKTGLNSGGSVSNSLGVFNTSNNSIWAWFTQENSDALDTYVPPGQFNLVYQGQREFAYNVRSFSTNFSFRPNITYRIDLEFTAFPSNSNQLYLGSSSNNKTLLLGPILTGDKVYSFTITPEVNLSYFTFNSTFSNWTTMKWSIYEFTENRSKSTKSGDQIIDFITPNLNEIQRGLGDGKSSSERR